MIIIAYALGIISGIAATVQASFNNEIRRSFRSPYITAIINFIVALSIAAVILLIKEHSLALPLGEIATHPVWIWTGGICGAIIVMTGILCLPVLGSARNIMLLCFGQIMAGLLIDHFGLFGAPITKMTAARAIGAVLETAGIILISKEKHIAVSPVKITITAKNPGADVTASAAVLNPEGSAPGSKIMFFIFLDIFAGFAAAMQVAVNGTLATAAGSPFRATLISMLGALITTGTVTVLIILLKGRPRIYDVKTSSDTAQPVPSGFRPIFLVGGSMALVVVGGNAFTGPLLGTGIVTMMNLFGMMAAGLAVDASGFLGIDRKPVTFRKLAGMALMLAGTALISL